MISFAGAFWHFMKSFEVAVYVHVEQHVWLIAVALLGIAFAVAAYIVGRNDGRADAEAMDADERDAIRADGYAAALDDHADLLVGRESPTPRIEHGNAGHVCSQTCWKTGGPIIMARDTLGIVAASK